MNLLLEPIVFLVLVSPLFLIGKKIKSWKSTFLVLFIAYFIVDSILTRLPFEYEAFAVFDLNMNWEGKMLSYLGVCLFLLVYKELPLKAYGFTLEQKEGTRKYSNRMLLSITVIISIYGYLIGGFSASLENILFQITMPSVVEELVYRGILLALLNQIYERQFNIGKTNFGVGLIITSLLFGLWHGLSVSSAFVFEMNWFAFILTGIIGFVLGLVRERTGSLLYPIILHILINLIPNIIGLLLAL